MPKKSSTLGTEARKVKLSVRQLVLHEAGYKCSNPACRYPLTLDVHHLYYVSEGGCDLAENLLPLCPNCHTEHHNGNVPTESLRAWKMLLLALNEAFDQRAIDLLLMVDRLGEITKVSGDGLAAYAPLVASDFISVSEVKRPAGSSGPWPTMTEMYVVALTDKGKLFVEGWKKGDQRAAIGALQSVPQEQGRAH